MTLWELRRWMEDAIPAWTLLVAALGGVVVWVVLWWRDRR
jgi:hypothetical protein